MYFKLKLEIVLLMLLDSKSFVHSMVINGGEWIVNLGRLLDAQAHVCCYQSYGYFVELQKPKRSV